MAVLRFWWLNMVLLPVQLGLLALFVEGLSQNPVVANVVVLSIVFVVRYLATTMWVYERPDSATSARLPARHGQPEVLAPTISRSVVLPTGPVPRVALRLGAAIVAALLAFPAVAVHAWHLLSGQPLTAVAGAFVACVAAAVVTVRAAPPTGDPDVHDRQLDVILALPALAAALFLSFAWPQRFTAAGLPGSREVVAFTVFLTGAAVLLLGTRCTARLRLLLLAPLLMLPAVENAPALALVLLVVFGVLAGRAAWDGLTAGRAAIGRRWPALPGRPLPARAPVTAPVRSLRAPTKLPTWQPTMLLVLAVAAVLGFLAVATPAPDVAAPITSLGTP